jgi:serine/threonine protein kinase
MTATGGRSSGRYGRWTDCGPLHTSQPHIRIVEDSVGNRAVLKKPRGNSETSRARFREEAHGMAALSRAGQSGILPVIELDEADPPKWFVMPRADILSAALGARPDLSQVVKDVEHVASTLITLAQRGIAHRDLKPSNLFRLNGEPVVGDLGIATWPRRHDLTMPGAKMGPAYFIAPEARRHEEGINYSRCDVWSLAKTLFVLARPEQGPYPPDGTHYVIARECSLWTVGQEAGLALGSLLEAATQFQPAFRLNMTRFRDELRDWLELYPVGTVQRPGHSAFRRGWHAIEGEPEQARRRSQAMRSILNREIRAISQRYLAEEDSWISDRTEIDEIAAPPAEPLADYSFTPNTEDGFEPDDYYLVATRSLDNRGRRFVLWAVLENDRITMFAEMHTVAGQEAALVQYWHYEASTLLPSCAARMADLHNDIVEWTDRHD